MTLCLEGLIIIAGVIASAILAAILGSIGYAISKIASYANYNLFIIIFAAPAAIILVLYLLVSLLIFSPTAYIITNNVNISAGETIGTCYRSMINNGKMTVFLTYFISSFFKLLYWAALLVGGYFVFKLYVPDKYFVISVIGCAVVSLTGYLMFAPILTLTNRVVKEHLFEDIVLDPEVAARINEKVNLSVCDGKKIEKVTNQNLASLFEYAEDPYRILEETEKKSQRFKVEEPKPAEKKVKKKIKNRRESAEQEFEDGQYEDEQDKTVEPSVEPSEEVVEVKPAEAEQINTQPPEIESPTAEPQNNPEPPIIERQIDDEPQTAETESDLKESDQSDNQQTVDEIDEK